MRRAPQSREAGFSLIETLVALTVFTACYILVQQSISGSWMIVRAAQSEEAALAIAQRQLAITGIATGLLEGTSGGVSDDGYRWVVDVRRYVPPGDQSANPLLAYWVDVNVTWRESPLRPPRSLSLTSVRLAVDTGAPR